MLEKLANAWASGNLDEVMAQYHPRFRGPAVKDAAALREIIETKLFPVTKQFKVKLSEIRVEGNIAYVIGKIRTDVGIFPTTNRYIKDGERWFILENQPQKAAN